jgi:tetratricopeptide (TPR) repeat protein
VLAEAARVGDQLGGFTIARYARAALVGSLIWRGHWDEGLQLAENWIAESSGEVATAELPIRRNRARVLAARDEVDRALEDVSVAVDGSRALKDPQTLIPTLGAAARVYLDLGRDADARELAAELIELVRESTDWRVLDFCLIADRLGCADELRMLIERHPATPMRAANLAAASTEWERAAVLLDEIGIASAVADAHSLAATKLESEGRRDDAQDHLEQALTFYRSVRATRYIRECESFRRSLEVSA